MNTMHPLAFSPIASTSHSSATELQVSLGDRSYPILIGPSLLDNPDAILQHLLQARVALITNETLWPLFGKTLATRLGAQQINVLPIVLPDGEAHKDWTALNQIFDALLQHACDRKTTELEAGAAVGRQRILFGGDRLAEVIGSFRRIVANQLLLAGEVACLAALAALLASVRAARGGLEKLLLVRLIEHIVAQFGRPTSRRTLGDGRLEQSPRLGRHART